MRKLLLILCFLAFVSNMALAQYRLAPSTIDTTLLQSKNYFQKDSSNMQGDYKLTAGYHLQSAGVDLMSSVIIGVVGGLLTGVLVYSGSGRSQSSQATQSMTYSNFGESQSNNDAHGYWMAPLLTGGVTLVASLTLVVAAGDHLNKAGKIMNGLSLDK